MPDRETYHHGNLREALIEAASDLIREEGAHFTLAEAARRAGVSAAAPYRHFRGRDELVEEVARRGFIEFADRLEAAYDKARPNALTAFTRMGQCYLAFAREKPGYYIAMFESGVSIADNPELSLAAERAMTVMAGASVQLFAHVAADKQPPPRMVANHIWAMSHGVVELFSRGKPGSRTPYTPEEMLESGVMIYLRGLGLMGGPAP